MCKYCNYCMSAISDDEKVCSICGHDTTVNVPAHHLLPGTLLNGKFYVGKALGEGGFGITYIGRDVNLDMKVAIKEYYPNGYVNRSNTTSPQVNDSITAGRKDFFVKGRERFLREARILAKFSGEPGIVDVRDFFEENNTAYIIMEYLDGKDLKDYLKEKGTLTGEQTVRLLTPLMNSLKKVHEQNLIHRDISPDNIMLVGDKVKLLDFGAARSVAAAENKSLSVMLKPGYAPEEQYRSKGNQGPWTDIYALCATMYKCITGITPDDATQRVFSDEVKTPTALGIKISADIERAIMRGMSVQQKDRYQNIDDLIRGLQGIEVEYDGSDTTIATNRKSEDDIVTRMGGSEDDLLTDVGAPEAKKQVSEDDMVTQYGGSTEDDMVTIMGDPEPVNQAKDEVAKKEEPVKKDEPKNERVKETPSKDNSPVKNTPPVAPTKERESILPKSHIQPNEIIADKEETSKKKAKSKKKIALIILGIIAALIVGFIIFVIAITSTSKNKIDPTVEGFYVENEYNTTGDGDLVWREPENELVPEDIYSSIEYNERMFYGSYTLTPSDSHDAELTDYQDAVDYSADVYNNYGLYLTNIPYRIVAGPQNQQYNSISQIPDEQWMNLYFYGEDGVSYPVDAAYKIQNNKLVVTPVVYYEINEDGSEYEYELSENSIVYDFEFSGPYLTLSYDGDSVELVADGFEKERADVDYIDNYDLYTHNMVSPGSAVIDNIRCFDISFNESFNTLELFDMEDNEIYDSIGKLTYDGLFTFSYSDGHEKNTQYTVHQFVYFYCGDDGLVLTDGENTYYYQEPYSFIEDEDKTVQYDIIDFTTGNACVFGLKADGTVVVAGSDELDVSGWTGIIDIDASTYQTVGLKSDGTVVVAGYSADELGVSDWTDIIDISAGDNFIIGLKSDGTVVSSNYVGPDYYYYGQCNVEDWTDIIAISTGSYYTVGLKEDGTVVAIGDNVNAQCNVDEWTDIVAISTEDSHTIGLKSDGTVVATDFRTDDVSSWTDIVEINSSCYQTVGLKEDGTVVAIGFGDEVDVSEWSDIEGVSVGTNYIVRFNSDGTIVATGDNDYVQMVEALSN